MIYDIAGEVINKRSESLLERYQIGLETSMKDRDFASDCFHLLHYKCHKINLTCGGSYIDSPDWIKNKKATATVNDDGKCFQDAACHTKFHRNWKTSTSNVKN